ncbi:MAG TPA: GFA family protein [Candidatus Polarisedimenticolia bacterium]|jgi:hypothetical protein|nr:GFA family protein [Candidatus Polarisedimenticolia bacterium]
MKWKGGCFCGAVRYEVNGDPGISTHCHCEHCRRTSGAAFLTWVECPAAGFSFTMGTPGSFQSRPGVTRSFCTSCGTPLTYRHVDTPGTVDVTVCSLDEPARVTPQDHVYHDGKLPWVRLADGLPTYRRRRADGP